MANEVSMRQEVKKHVATIHTSGELSLLERKLVNVLLLNAFDQLLGVRRHSIPVSLLTTMVGWNDSNNISNLKKALIKIATTAIEFDLLGDASQPWSTSTLIAGASLKNGVCSYEYSSFLAEKMANPEVYATINIAIQNQFNGGYALTLYENCKRFRKVGSTGWIQVDVWRKLLGAIAPMYDEFRHLSNHVIKKAVNEINQVSDLRITPEYQRKLRKVTHIKFLIEDNPQKSIYDAKALDEYDEIRQSNSYRRLIAHGIGEKLAITWIVQETDERIAQAIDYVEERDRKKLIRGSTGGYIRTLIENKADTGESDYNKKKKSLTEKAKNVQEAEAVFASVEAEREKRFKASVKLMTLEDRKSWVAKYFASAGAGREKYYDSEKATFKRGEPNINFLTWLRPLLQNEFNKIKP